MQLIVSLPYDKAVIAIRRSAAPKAVFVPNGSLWMMDRGEFVALTDAVAASAAVDGDVKEEIDRLRSMAERVVYRLADLIATFNDKLGPRFKAVGISPRPCDDHNIIGLVLMGLHGTMKRIPGMSEARDALLKTATSCGCGLEAEVETLIDDIDALIEERKAVMIKLPIMGHATDEDAVEAAELITDLGFQVIRHRVDRMGDVRVIVAGKDASVPYRVLKSYKPWERVHVSITAI